MSRSPIPHPLSVTGAAAGRAGRGRRRLQTVWRIGLIIAVLILFSLTLCTVRVQGEPAGLVDSTPKAEEVIDGSEVLISLLFEEPVDHEASTLTLKSEGDERPLTPSLKSGAKYLVANAGRLEPGEYELLWEAKLAGGETRSGTIPFTVR